MPASGPCGSPASFFCFQVAALATFRVRLDSDFDAAPTDVGHGPRPDRFGSVTAALPGGVENKQKSTPPIRVPPRECESTVGGQSVVSFFLFCVFFFHFLRLDSISKEIKCQPGDKVDPAGRRVSGCRRCRARARGRPLNLAGPWHSPSRATIIRRVATRRNSMKRQLKTVQLNRIKPSKNQKKNSKIQLNSLHERPESGKDKKDKVKKKQEKEKKLIRSGGEA